MINRCHLRIKVMQILYSQYAANSKPKELLKILKERSLKFYLFFITYLLLFRDLKREFTEKEKIVSNKNFNNDVFFAMSHGVHRGVLKKGKFDQRENFINKLISVTPNVRFDLYGMNGVQPVWADNYLLAISQSKIGLNLSQGKPAEFYSSDRFAQLIGNGLLVMVDEKTKIGNFFNKEEIVLYKNIKDLSSKITKFSNDNKLRCKIAKKGRDKYFKYFNSTIVADFIINKTIGTKKKFYWENV